MDKRVVATKKHLKGCLVEILKTQKLDEITVKMICDMSGINRSTFYRHYDSINTLYDEMHEDFLSGLIDTMRMIHEHETVDLVFILEKCLEYALKNKDECCVVLEKTIIPGFEVEFNKRYREKMNLLKDLTQMAEKNQYLHAFISAGIVNATIQWLKKNDRMPIYEMARCLVSYINFAIQPLENEKGSV